MMRFVLIMFLILSPSLFGYSLDAGRIVGSGGAVLLSKPSLTGFLECLVSFLTDRQLTGESGFCRKFELRDLDIVYGGAAYRRGTFSGGIAFSQFGRGGYYTEKLLRGALAAYIDPAVIGITVSGKILEFGDYDESFNAVSIGLASGMHYGRFHLAVTVDNINKPRIGPSSPAEYQRLNFYAEIEGPSMYSFYGRLAFEENQKPRATIAQDIRLLDNNALF